MKNKKNDQELLLFLLITFGIPSVLIIPILVFGLTTGFFYYVLIGLSAMSPTLSAFLTTYLTEGRQGIYHLLSQSFKKFPIRMAVIILLGPSLMMITALYLNDIFFHTNLLMWMIPSSLLTVFVSPIGEELGWRGFLTNRLSLRFSLISTSLIIGLLWGIWHYFYFLIPGPFNNDSNYILFLVGCIMDTLWFTWFFSVGNRSALTGILLHASYNLGYNIFPIDDSDVKPYIILLALELILGIYLLMKEQRKRNSPNLYLHIN